MWWSSIYGRLSQGIFLSLLHTAITKIVYPVPIPQIIPIHGFPNPSALSANEDFFSIITCSEHSYFSHPQSLCALVNLPMRRHRNFRRKKLLFYASIAAIVFLFYSKILIYIAFGIDFGFFLAVQSFIVAIFFKYPIRDAQCCWLLQMSPSNIRCVQCLIN